MKPITHAAIRENGVIYSLPKPYRHHHIFRAMRRYASIEKIAGYDIQGFLDGDDIFLDRKQAMQRVLDIGQELMSPLRSELFSEEVWDTPGVWDAPEGTPERALWEYHESEEQIRKLFRRWAADKSVGQKFTLKEIMADICEHDRRVVNFNIKKECKDDVHFSVRFETLYSHLYLEPLSEDATKDDFVERLEKYVDTSGIRHYIDDYKIY